MAKARIALKPALDGSSPALDDPTLIRILELLGTSRSCELPAGYVAGGKLRRLSPAVDLASGFFSLTVAFVVVV